jgi:prolyl oligopeptidase
VIHGVEIIDPYRWLEEQESPETRAWIESQNRYSEALLRDRPSLPGLRKRLAELMGSERVSVPVVRQGAYFFTLQRVDQSLAIICRRAGPKGETEVLVDPHPLSSDHTTSVGLMDVSADGRRLAYNVRPGGTDEVEIRILDVATKRDLPDRLPYGLYGSLSFTGDGNAFYYARRNRETGNRIFLHRLGTEVTRDVLVFGEGYGRDKWVNGFVSDDGRYLLLTVGHGWGRSEIYLKDIAAEGPIRTVVNDIDAHFNVRFAGERLVVHTDWKAPKYRVMLADAGDPAPSSWREIVPEGEDVLQSVSVIGGRIFATYLHNVATVIKMFSLSGEALGAVTLPGLGSASVAGEAQSEEAFVTFSSFTTPPTVFRDKVATGERDIWSRPSIDLAPDAFSVSQVWYRSKDQTRVPMFLVHKKGLAPDGNRPLLLYGYGGFNVAQTPGFRPAAVAWAEEGGVFALANIRGVSEFASPGIERACWKTSKTSSMTSLPRRSGSSPTATPAPRGWRFKAPATAVCWWAPR